MYIQAENIEATFHALDAQIGLNGGSPIRLVICGGTALVALGLLLRTTRDADVLGEIRESSSGGVSVGAMKEFPDWLAKAAEIVRRDFHLPDKWLNLGPASQVESGLPEGFVGRLVKKPYGRLLTVYYIGRIDQIHFKLYAATDRLNDRNDYHRQDLLALKPTEPEIEQAARWTLTQDVSEAFRMELRECLRRIGYAPIAERI